MDKNIRDMVAADIADDKLEDYQPYPAGVNDGPFMSYDKLQTGAYGKPAPKQSEYEKSASRIQGSCGRHCKEARYF
jgi:hypothetical protein